MGVLITFVIGTSFFFFFNDTATTEIYTLSLHDALPISDAVREAVAGYVCGVRAQPEYGREQAAQRAGGWGRSEEHTSELQSQSNLVCRLLLEKKKHEPSSSRACQHRGRACGSSRPVASS